MVWSTVAFVIALVFLLVGLLGTLLPAIPGVGLMWVVILIYAIGDRFAAIDPTWFAVLTLLGLGGATSDVWLGLLGAKVGGASIWSTLFSLVGMLLGGIIGLLIGGISAFPAMLIGSVLGVMLNEYRERKEWKAAWRATLGLAVGFTLSGLLQFCIGVGMIVLFIWQVVKG